MIAKLTPFLEYLLHGAMAEIPSITHRSMFGGYGLYKSGIFFGIVAYDVVYFKVDADTKQKYEDEGSKPFVYNGKGKPSEMSYWQVPDAVMEDPERLECWVQEACQAYLRSKKKRRGKS